MKITILNGEVQAGKASLTITWRDSFSDDLVSDDQNAILEKFILRGSSK